MTVRDITRRVGRYSVETQSGLESLLVLGIVLEAELGSAALVAEELRVNTGFGGIALARGALDAIPVLLAGLVVSGVVL